MTDFPNGIELSGLTASKGLRLNSSGEVASSGQSLETTDIANFAGYEAGGVAGITTTFLDADGNTITVTKGLITAKTAP